ncbi:hypothetical protein V7457_28505 [Bacillus toyonensis]|uniref:hypothetical protein n=1 Tax=Bacillus toyonensis TaxID=155322 RepID=UPI000BEF37EC|nr:hypothetical protein [Bacillus toyonensis]PEJ00552.1 hypothetical protein CN671_19740 [Bacillus toyonensis]
MIKKILNRFFRKNKEESFKDIYIFPTKSENYFNLIRYFPQSNPNLDFSTYYKLYLDLEKNILHIYEDRENNSGHISLVNSVDDIFVREICSIFKLSNPENISTVMYISQDDEIVITTYGYDKVQQKFDFGTPIDEEDYHTAFLSKKDKVR